MKSSLVQGMLLFAISIMASNSGLACSFNTDCEIGSQCIKNGGLYGVCLGGMNPGNSNDRQPATDLQGGAGWTCSFKTDCDIGYACIKSGLQGVCLKE